VKILKIVSDIWSPILINRADSVNLVRFDTSRQLNRTDGLGVGGVACKGAARFRRGFAFIMLWIGEKLNETCDFHDESVSAFWGVLSTFLSRDLIVGPKSRTLRRDYRSFGTLRPGNKEILDYVFIDLRQKVTSIWITTLAFGSWHKIILMVMSNSHHYLLIE
jgi:hypothetical protein